MRFGELLKIAPDESSISGVAEKLMETIGDNIVISHTAALATAILRVKHTTLAGLIFHKKDLEEEFHQILLLDGEEKVEGWEKRLDAAIGIFQMRGFIAGSGDGETFEITDEPLVRQYANRIAHKVK